MKTENPFIKLYGASDDLIEIESNVVGNNEFYYKGKKQHVSFDDGTILSIEYGNEGTWDIKLVERGTGSVSIVKNKGADSDQYSDVATVSGATGFRITVRKMGPKKEKRTFYMQWREDFDDQWGWFTESELKKEIERIRKLEDDEDGEASISSIIQGKEVTEDFT